MLPAEISVINQRLQRVLAPTQIYLFGSYARDSFTPDSDYDFYVVVPDDAGDRIELAQQAYRALRGVRTKPVDIVVGHASDFNRRVQEDTLERTVLREGVLLYATQ